MPGKKSNPVTVINDADAAGLAEMKFGAGQGQRGVVLLSSSFILK